MTETLTKFLEKYKELQYYNRVITLIDWDMYTATPDKGYEGMADALSFFAAKEFQLSTSPEMMDLLKKLNTPEEFVQLNEGMQFTVKTMLRDLEKESRIPESFITEYVNAVSASRKAWEKAKQSSDYSIFAPHLQKIIDLTIQRCGYTDPGKDPYDVLLDRHEEGVDSSVIDRVFGELKDGLLPMLDQILARPYPTSSVYENYFDPDDQKKVQELLLRYEGFSFEAGTTAESEHPFTLGFSKYDTRVTNHFYEHSPIDPMFTAIHEGGHAIFEQNASDELQNTAAADCSYMGIHESQSRFFENILARRKSFWIPIYEKVQELLPGLKEMSLDDFVAECNHVTCSMIRTKSDEVTYCLHIILRYEVEQEIFRNGKRAEELPAIWNQKMKSYLHLTPSNDAEGILQDMHWPYAYFGYFPT